MSEYEFVGGKMRLGTEPHYHDPGEGKPLVAFARLVKANWERTEAGEFIETEPVWYSAVFKGKDAKLLEMFESGDPLIVMGNFRPETREYNGKTYSENRLYVTAFSADLNDKGFVPHFDRSLRPGWQTEQAQKVVTGDTVQEATQTPAVAGYHSQPVSGGAAGKAHSVAEQQQSHAVTNDVESPSRLEALNNAKAYLAGQTGADTTQTQMQSPGQGYRM